MGFELQSQTKGCTCNSSSLNWLVHWSTCVCVCCYFLLCHSSSRLCFLLCHSREDIELLSASLPSMVSSLPCCMPSWGMKVGNYSVGASISASLTDLKRIQTPHSLLREQTKSILEPSLGIWLSAIPDENLSWEPVGQRSGTAWFNMYSSGLQ